MSDDVVNLLAKKFIQRRDVRALQRRDGSWTPETSNGRVDGPRIPWDRAALTSHVDGQRTYGHYLLDLENKCKLFAFDVDLKKSGTYFVIGDETQTEYAVEDLRGAWLDRAHPGRPYFKLQFHEVAHKLCRGIYEALGLPCAAAYSGGKGIHVYGFTGPLAAADVREGAAIVLDSVGGFSATRGTNFFGNDLWPNLEIELFPKQSSLDGKDLGNLMRLPLGKNLKNPADPTFFVDLSSPFDEIRPIDPEWALTTDNPWKSPYE